MHVCAYVCVHACVCVLLGLFLVMECGFIQCDTSGGPEALFVQFHNQWTFALGTLVPLESGVRWTTLFHLHQRNKVFSWKSNVERGQGAESGD